MPNGNTQFLYGSHWSVEFPQSFLLTIFIEFYLSSLPHI